MATLLVLSDLDEQTKETFLAGCIKSGMRETRCEVCGCYLVTRNEQDVCPPCRKRRDSPVGAY
jgi:rubrerythrin